MCLQIAGLIRRWSTGNIGGDLHEVLTLAKSEPVKFVRKNGTGFSLKKESKLERIRTHDWERRKEEVDKVFAAD